MTGDTERGNGHVETEERPSPRLIIVVPCYNEQEVLETTDRCLRELLRSMISAGDVASGSRVMYVDDGSRDATWPLIERLTREGEGLVSGLKLAANVGHQKALVAGMHQAMERGADAIVTIDADLQDDPEVIRRMAEAYRRGADVVYGVRRRRDTDTAFKRNSALAFYKLMERLGVKTVYNHADFRLLSRASLMDLDRYSEENLFLRGLVPLLGRRQESVYYDRTARMAGESKYPLRKMLSFAIDGITSFSVKPVRLVMMLGMIFMLVALGILIYVLVRHFSGDTIPGWSSTILSIWFCSGVILVSLGIVGEYIGKIYNEVKRRPRYSVDRYVE